MNDAKTLHPLMNPIFIILGIQKFPNTKDSMIFESTKILLKISFIKLKYYLIYFWFINHSIHPVFWVLFWMMELASDLANHLNILFANNDEFLTQNKEKMNMKNHKLYM